MIHPQILRQQLDKLGVGTFPFCRAELKELPNLMIPGEEVEQIMAGRYNASYAIIVATNFRILIIDKKLGFGLVFEDIPYDMLAEVEYIRMPFASKLIVFARSKKIEFKAYNAAPVKQFAQYLEQRMMDARSQVRNIQEHMGYGSQATYQGTGSY